MPDPQRWFRYLDEELRLRGHELFGGSLALHVLVLKVPEGARDSEGAIHPLDHDGPARVLDPFPLRLVGGLVILHRERERERDVMLAVLLIHIDPDPDPGFSVNLAVSCRWCSRPYLGLSQQLAMMMYSSSNLCG